MRDAFCVVVLWLWLVLGAGAEVPVRVGHSDAFGADLAEYTRLTLRLRPGSDFHVTVVGPSADGGTADDLALLRATLAGNCHLAWVRSDTLTNFDRTWGLLSIPFLFPSLQAERDWVTSGRLQRNPGKAGLLALALVERGPRLFVSREPLDSLAELKGRRVAVPRDRFLRDFVEELGAELADDGSVRETDERSLPADDYPHELRSGHGLSWAVLVVNQAWFERLSPQQQGMLREFDDDLHLQRVGRANGDGGPPLPARPDPAVSTWRARLKALRERSLRLIGQPWSELFPP